MALLKLALNIKQESTCQILEDLHLCEIYASKADAVWCPLLLGFQDKWNKFQSNHSVKRVVQHLALQNYVSSPSNSVFVMILF